MAAQATTTTRQRKSKAQRAAEQAEADAIKAAEAGEIEPTTEAAEQAAAAAVEEAAEAAAKPEQPKPTEPYALLASVEAPFIYYRGQVQVRVPGPDGIETVETIECSCPWAHTTPAIAERCGRKLASSRGLKVRAG